MLGLEECKQNNKQVLVGMNIELRIFFLVDVCEHTDKNRFLIYCFSHTTNANSPCSSDDLEGETGFRLSYETLSCALLCALRLIGGFCLQYSILLSFRYLSSLVLPERIDFCKYAFGLSTESRFSLERGHVMWMILQKLRSHYRETGTE